MQIPFSKAVVAMFLLVMVVCSTRDVFAHPGRTNRQGCHTNRKTGDFHCHGSGQSPPSKRVKPGVSKPPFETPSNVESSGGSLSTGSSGEEDSQAKAKPKPKLKKWKGRKRGHKRPKKSKPEKKPNPVNAPDTTAAAKNMDMVSHWCSVLCCPLSIVLLAILLVTRLFLRRKGNRLREQDRHHEQGQIYVDANHAHREYDRATVARTVDKMRKAKGPKSRRNALGTGLTELRLTESQPALWEEYCRVCTDATLEKVASLKTTKAKQRRIDNMIEELSTSPISEHVRNELIARLQSPPEPQDPPKPDVIDIELG